MTKQIDFSGDYEGLIGIIAGQQTVLESLIHRVEQLEKAKTRRT